MSNVSRARIQRLQRSVFGLRERLAREISRILARHELTQREVAELLGVSQPDVSKLKKAQANGFSLERLLQFLAGLGHKIVLSISRDRRSKGPIVRVDTSG